jgi:hypothetical protein
MSEFLDAVDDAEDPSPPATGKYTVHVKGEARNLPLVAAKKIENRARRWMVSTAWLALPDNKKFDAPSYILDNGRAWGDPKDPEEILAGQKRVKEEKRLISSRKRIKIEAMEERGKVSAKGKGKAKANSKAREQPVASTSAVVPTVASSSTLRLPPAAESDDEFSE